MEKNICLLFMVDQDCEIRLYEKSHISLTHSIICERFPNSVYFNLTIYNGSLTIKVG